MKIQSLTLVISWQTISIQILLMGKATKRRELCQPIRARTYSSLREITKDRSQQSTKESYRHLILDLLAMVFEEHSVEKK